MQSSSTQALAIQGDSTPAAGSKTLYYPQEVIQFTRKVIWVTHSVLVLHGLVFGSGGPQRWLL